jgi:hypothetical protein
VKHPIITFILIVLAYSSLGPIFPLALINGPLLDSKLLIISYMMGLIPALCAGIYLAFQAVRQRAFVDFHYFCITILSSIFNGILVTVYTWNGGFGYYAGWYIPIASAIAGITAIIFKGIIGKILSKTRFSLIPFSSKTAGAS